MKLKICIVIINITLTLYFIRYKLKFNCDTDFYYTPDTRTVTWALVVPSNYDDLFRDILYNELGLKYEADTFLLSLMHEIGHSQTWEDIADEDLDECDKIKARIEKKKKQTKNDYLKYFHLYDEMVASEWAVNFINSHPNKLKVLWKILKREILFLYKMNNVEVEYDNT